MSAYLIAEVDVTDTVAYDEYRQGVLATITAHGGHFLCRGGAITLLEGGRMPKRTVVLEFPTMDALTAWYDSPAYRPLRALRQRAANSNVFAVEGVPTTP